MLPTRTSVPAPVFSREPLPLIVPNKVAVAVSSCSIVPFWLKVTGLAELNKVLPVIWSVPVPAPSKTTLPVPRLASAVTESVPAEIVVPPL